MTHLYFRTCSTNILAVSPGPALIQEFSNFLHYQLAMMMLTKCESFGNTQAVVNTRERISGTHLTLISQPMPLPCPSICPFPPEYHWHSLSNCSRLGSGNRNSRSSRWSKPAYIESTNPCPSNHRLTPVRNRANGLALSPRGEHQAADGQKDVSRKNTHRRARA